MSGRSRALLLVLCVLLTAGIGVAADLPFSFTAPYRLVVPFETFQLMPGADALGQACGSTNIHGCTVFYGRRLDCRCFPDEDHWHVHARAQFIPHIVLADRAVLDHERMHIDEVRNAVDNHLSVLTTTEYHSAIDCENAGRAASDAFASVMDRFQRDSNAKHHPMYVHALEEEKQ